MIKLLWNGILDLLYPRKCVLCTALLSRSETDLCRRCRMSTERISHPIVRGKFFSCCYSVYYYKKDVASAVKRMKFSGKDCYGQAFGRLLALRLLEEKVTADLITWVPVSRRRRRQRGYDQGEEIARAVGKELGIPTARLLRKTRHTLAQARLEDRAQRRANVANAFAPVDPEKIQGKKLILIDDVITSGATLSECSKVLRAAGAETVVCGTFAAARDG